jgi:hypothetical protein
LGSCSVLEKLGIRSEEFTSHGQFKVCLDDFRPVF